MSVPKLSPSLHHRLLMDGTVQSSHYTAGAAERCQLVVGDGGHRFYADAAWPVMLKELARLRG